MGRFAHSYEILLNFHFYIDTNNRLIETLKIMLNYDNFYVFIIGYYFPYL